MPLGDWTVPKLDPDLSHACGRNIPFLGRRDDHAARSLKLSSPLIRGRRRTRLVILKAGGPEMRQLCGPW
jgi:hypothetical protein